MSARGWYVLDGRRVLAGPFTEPPAPELARTWLHEQLQDLARHAVVTPEEIQRRLRAVRVEFGVRASRGGFRRLPQPGSRGVARGA